ncbi:hypothetical protein BHE74_00057370 [Ensete ventricosum]|nr:hypothetical protein BHE74_00057370 [Ensete ventricosum]
MVCLADSRLAITLRNLRCSFSACKKLNFKCSLQREIISNEVKKNPPPSNFIEDASWPWKLPSCALSGDLLLLRFPDLLSFLLHSSPPLSLPVAADHVRSVRARAAASSSSTIPRCPTPRRSRPEERGAGEAMGTPLEAIWSPRSLSYARPRPPQRKRKGITPVGGGDKCHVADLVPPSYDPAGRSTWTRRSHELPVGGSDDRGREGLLAVAGDGGTSARQTLT